MNKAEGCQRKGKSRFSFEKECDKLHKKIFNLTLILTLINANLSSKIYFL